MGGENVGEGGNVAGVCLAYLDVTEVGMGNAASCLLNVVWVDLDERCSDLVAPTVAG